MAPNGLIWSRWRVSCANPTILNFRWPAFSYISFCDRWIHSSRSEETLTLPEHLSIVRVHPLHTMQYFFLFNYHFSLAARKRLLTLASFNANYTGLPMQKFNRNTFTFIPWYHFFYSHFFLLTVIPSSILTYLHPFPPRHRSERA